MTLTIDSSDYTGATSKLPKILLNGNNICMVKNDFQDDRVLCTNSDSSSFLAACLRATHDPLPHFRNCSKQVSKLRTLQYTPTLCCISSRQAICANTQYICPSSGQCIAILATKLAFALPRYAERNNYSASAARHLYKQAHSARICTTCIPVPYSSLAMNPPC
jgi:hypothetical protein